MAPREAWLSMRGVRVTRQAVPGITVSAALAAGTDDPAVLRLAATTRAIRLVMQQLHREQRRGMMIFHWADCDWAADRLAHACYRHARHTISLWTSVQMDREPNDVSMATLAWTAARCGGLRAGHVLQAPGERLIRCGPRDLRRARRWVATGMVENS